MIKIWRKKKDEIDNAPINGIITITFLPFVNLVSVPLIIMAIFGTSIFDFPTFNKWNILYIFAGFGFFNYWILLRNGKSHEIIKRFNQLDAALQKRGYRLTVLYLLITIMIPLIIFFFIPPRP